MSSGDTPALARRRLRLALRQAREALGLTQGQVAEALEWSLSKMNRIEVGEVTVSKTDLDALLRLYGVHDEAEITRLAEHARASRRRGWWDDPRFRPHLTPGMAQFLQFEAEAVAVRAFHATVVPGILQTREYAESVMRFWSAELTDQARAARVEVRLRRREQLLDRPMTPSYLLVLDESVLLREVGGPLVMADQLRELRMLAERPTVQLRILPLTDAGLLGLVGSFTILQLGDEQDDALYREAGAADEITHSPDVVGRYRNGFNEIWGKALAGDASARRLQAREATLRASLDR